MKPNRFVLPGGPVLISVPLRRSAIPRRLRITLWQTHSWIKKIINLESARQGSSDIPDSPAGKRAQGCYCDSLP